MARTNREFVMLADTFIKTKHRSAGMYLSEKLNGMRCLWVPASKGIPVKNLPFANRDKDIRDTISSGLWSRYGKPVFCPEWFTKDFPDFPLDGELWIGRGRGNLQALMSIVKKLEPIESEWQGVSYNIFDAPRYKQIFDTGRVVCGNNFTKQFKLEENLLAMGVNDAHPYYSTTLYFDAVYKLLQRDLKATKTMQLHPQRILPFNTPMAIEIIENTLSEVCAMDGEGLMLRHPASLWNPIRSDMLLKVKKLLDAEGVVVGYNTGKEGKEGRFRGMLGSLVVRWAGGTFNLSGCITQDQRTLTTDAYTWAYNNPDKLLPFDNGCPYFPLNTQVTFQYTELSAEGVPMNARFITKRPFGV